MSTHDLVLAWVNFQLRHVAEERIAEEGASPSANEQSPKFESLPIPIGTFPAIETDVIYKFTYNLMGKSDFTAIVDSDSFVLPVGQTGALQVGQKEAKTTEELTGEVVKEEGKEVKKMRQLMQLASVANRLTGYYVFDATLTGTQDDTKEANE